jgi:glycogen(starch) synthase
VTPYGSEARLLVSGDPFFLARHRPLTEALRAHWAAVDELPISERAVAPALVELGRALVAGRLWPPTRAALRAVRERLAKRASTFDRLSRKTERAIEAAPAPPPALVLQLFAMSSPSAGALAVPYAHYIDLTMAFVRRMWPAWAPFDDERDYDAWIARESRSYRGAERVFTFSEATRRSVIDDYGVAPERVVAVGAAGFYRDVPSAARAYGTRSIVFNGSDFERKGGDLALAAFARIRAVFPDATLAIVGTAGVRPQPGVTVLGNQSRTALFERFDRTDIVLAPARLEGFPGFALEAMSRGVVPILSDCPTTAEMIVDGVEGAIVSPCTAERLAERAVAFLADPDRLPSLGAAARARVERDWNWPAVARRMLASLRA